jgi:cell pole-organizing protein PopZ
VQEAPEAPSAEAATPAEAGLSEPPAPAAASVSAEALIPRPTPEPGPAEALISRPTPEHGPAEEPLVSPPAEAAAGQAFQRLSETVRLRSAMTMEEHVTEMLRPMLRAWLDENLPPLVERLVQAEIERISRGR